MESQDVREKSCLAWDKECLRCRKKRHFQKVCQGRTREDKVRADGNKVRADGNTMVLQKRTAGTANAHIRSRGTIMHAKVARK